VARSEKRVESQWRRIYGPRAVDRESAPATQTVSPHQKGLLISPLNSDRMYFILSEERLRLAKKAGTEKPAKKSAKPEKRVDQAHHLTGKRRGAILKEEVWYDGNIVVKYSLAYIDPRVGVDNGRVLGFDNTHSFHHRHYRGEVEKVEFSGYAATVDRFEGELEEIWRAEDEKKER
jgi:hypothetical protein